jgi:type 2 lantibiotic biosynthesis protein LanM
MRAANKTDTLPPDWWVAGTTARDPDTALTAVQPAWAEFVEQALAGTSTAAPPPDTTHWRTAFAAPFRPLVDQACRLAADRLHDRAPGVAQETITRRLDDRIAELSARTLVLLVNRHRHAGTLTGETSADRFADFIRRLSLVEVFTEFPVLARLIGQICLQTVDSHCELLERLAADRAAIATLCGEPRPLVRIEHHGDSHQRGRTVAVLEFADGRRVVYKPRPVDAHARLAELCRWLDDQLLVPGPDTAKVVPRNGYGWVAFVGQEPCADLAEVNRFYRGQGVLLALLHAIDGTDVHCENLISRRDRAVLIDAETMPHPTIFEPDDPAGRALGRSVLRTSLLPQMFLGEHGALDISGLGGDRGAPYPADAVRWADPCTDEMRLVRAPAEFQGSANRPMLTDREVDPVEHGAALLSGFRLGYRALVAGRSELARRAGEFADDVVRVLVRPTRYYAVLLDESTHPSLLRDAADRDRVFGMLWTDPPVDDPAVVSAEIADLWAGDVPLLVTRPGTRDLWTSTGERIAGALPESALESVTAKIDGLGAADLRTQEWLVSAALATRSEVRHDSAETVAALPTVLERDRLLAAACGIADRIVATASLAGDQANWLGLDLVEDRHWQVLPMGASLGEGYGGVALFLAELARQTGIARYQDTSRAALRLVPGLLGRLRRDPELPRAAGPGAYLGLGGLGYALARLGPLLDAPAEWLPDLLELMPESEPGTPAGLATGLAGGVVAMRSVFLQTGLEEADILAKRYAEDLVAGQGAGPGFAHGRAGVAWALNANSDPLTDLAHPGWCTGAAGRVLAAVTVNGWTDKARHWAFGLANKPVLRDMSLCHGEMGVIEVLSELALHDSRLVQVRDRRAGQLVSLLERSGPRGATPGGVINSNPLTGLAGIGYGLLRLSCAGGVASMLLLETGRPGDARSACGGDVHGRATGPGTG